MSSLETKQKKTPWVLAVINFLICLIMLGAFVVGVSVAIGYHSVFLPFLAFALPFLIIAALNLIGGIFTLKGKNPIIGIFGLILFPIAVVYFMVLSAA